MPQINGLLGTHRSSLLWRDWTLLTTRGSSAFQAEPPPGQRLQYSLSFHSQDMHQVEGKDGLTNVSTLGQLISRCLSKDLEPWVFKRTRGLRAGCTEIHLCHCPVCVCLFENLRYVLKTFAYKGENILFALQLSYEDQGLCPKENQGTSDLQLIFQAC